ncbi:MAG: hypothetical protein ACYCX2_12220 [Christensenellales bacterium]
MKKFIPREKLSKKAKQQLNSVKRRTWGSLKPLTRRPRNPKAYQRNKPPGKTDEDPGAGAFFIYNPDYGLPFSNTI